MNDASRRQFREVAAACTPAMLALGYLIAGNQRVAERGLRHALTKTAKRWDRLGGTPPESYIMTTLCRHLLSWPQRLRRTSPDPGDPGNGVPGLRSAMRLALMALSRTDRAVLALRHHEQLTEAETAQVLACSRERVRRHTERATTRLRELLADPYAPHNSAPPVRPDDGGPRRGEAAYP